MARIVIQIHELDPFEHARYVLQALSEHWRQQGHEVIVHAGPDGLPAADVLISHIDLTIVPAAYRDSWTGHAQVLNRAAVDISKRRISHYLVSADDRFPGPVIVKTDRNAGGIGERRQRGLTDRRGRYARIHRLRHRLGLAGRNTWLRLRHGARPYRDYLLFAQGSRVPQWVWDDPALVVERFLPERDGADYVLRQWVFLGDRELAFRSRSPSPIVKSHNVTGREPTDVPEELRRWRKALGFDYGKFDYVVHEGRVILLDANRTPTYGGRDPDRLRTVVEHLAGGLEGYLRHTR